MATIVIDGLKSDGDLWNSITWSNINQIVHRFTGAYREGRNYQTFTAITVGCLIVLYQCLSPVRRKSHAGGTGPKALSLPDTNFLLAQLATNCWLCV
jgi:hypothetical protein